MKCNRYVLSLFLCGLLLSCGFIEESVFVGSQGGGEEEYAARFCWLTDGTETTAPSSPTNINQTTAYPIEWQTSVFDTGYFDHSTSTNSHELTVKVSGNYFIAATVPMTSALQRSCVRAEVRVNGAAVDGAIGESSYIRNVDNHTESSSHLAVLAANLDVGDVIELYVQETAISGTVTTDPVASLYVEYIQPERILFSATATQTTSGTNLNTATAAGLQWMETVKSAGFTHDDGSSPEQITVNGEGDYLVFVNVPITGAIQRGNIKVLVQVNGVTVPGGEGKQGYIRNADGHNDASVHWTGLIRGVSAGSAITLETEQESTAGTITVQSLKKASVFIERIDTAAGVFFSRATDLSGGSNWNPAGAQSVLWTNDDIIDSGVFSHSTTVESHQVTVNTSGNYLLVYNDSVTSTLQRANVKVTVNLNGAPVSGAQTKCHYIRNSDPHNESSGSLVFLLNDLSSGDVISLDTVQEAIAGQVDDNRDALLFLWRRP